MSTVARARSFDRDRDAFRPRRVAERDNVLLPGLLVEIRREEPACLVRPHGIDTGDEIDRITGRSPGQMGSNDVVAERDKCLIWAFSAFDLRLAADASDPLISTHRRIARLSALRHSPIGGETPPLVLGTGSGRARSSLRLVRLTSPGHRGVAGDLSMPLARAHVRAHAIGWRSPTVPGRAWTTALSGPRSRDAMSSVLAIMPPPFSRWKQRCWHILACGEPKGLVERSLTDFEPGRGLSHSQSFRDHAAGAGQFLGVDSRLAPALAASRSGGSKPRASAFAYQVALELPQRAEQVEYQPAARRRGVDRLGNRAEADTTLSRAPSRFRSDVPATAKPVQFPDDEHVAVAHVVERLP